MTSVMEDGAYELGRRARLVGDDKSDSPFDPDKQCLLFEAWLRGYEDAREARKKYFERKSKYPTRHVENGRPFSFIAWVGDTDEADSAAQQPPETDPRVIVTSQPAVEEKLPLLTADSGERDPFVTPAREPEPPPPKPFAQIKADCFLFVASAKVSRNGVFGAMGGGLEGVVAGSFPVELKAFGVLVKLWFSSQVAGRHQTAVMKVSTDGSRLDPDVTVEFSPLCNLDKKTGDSTVTVLFEYPLISLPKPGEYLFSLYVNDQHVQSGVFYCVRKEMDGFVPRGFNRGLVAKQSAGAKWVNGESVNYLTFEGSVIALYID